MCRSLDSIVSMSILGVHFWVLVFYVSCMKCHHWGELDEGRASQVAQWLKKKKKSACQCRRHRRQRFDPYFRKIPWRQKWLPTPVCLPGKSHGQRSLAGYTIHGVTKSLTLLSTHAWMKVLFQNKTCLKMALHTCPKEPFWPVLCSLCVQLQWK